jgi:hypothetical protein
MIPSPPSSFRIVALLIRIGLRRRVNQLSGRLSRGVRRRAATATRTATPRKHGRGVLWLLFFGAMMLFSSFNISRQTLIRLGNQIESARADTSSTIGVPSWLYDTIVSSDNMLRQIDKQPNLSKENRDQLRESQLEYLRSVFDVDNTIHRTTATQLKLETFNKSGAAGFHVVETPYTQFLPTAATWQAPGTGPQMMAGAGLLLSLFFLAMIFTALGSGNQDLGKVDWNLEWLFTFPVSARAIFLAQILQNAASSFFIWVAVFPFLTTVFWSAGRGLWAAPLGLAGAFYVCLVVAAVRNAAETWLRKHFAHTRLKNLQALCTVIGMLGFMGVMALGLMPALPDWFMAAIKNLRPAWLWSPTALPVLLAGDGPLAWTAALALFTLALGAPAASIMICARLVRHGLITESGVYQGRRGPAGSAYAAPAMFFKGIVAKELRLLLRDRNFMVQTLVMPLIVIGFQLLINPGLFRAVGGDFRHAAVLAFGVGAYALMSNALGVLAVEGKALWLLYTFPQPIDRIMRRKTLLWAVVGLVFTTTILAIAWTRNPSFAVPDLANMAMAIVGVVIYAFIAAGIGVLGTDPLQQEVSRKFKPSLLYLYMFLAAMYAYGIYEPAIWSKIAMVTLCSLLAYAIWQRVRDQAPYLLDPTQLPPPGIALSDGLIATLVFFVIQGTIHLLLMLEPGASSAMSTTIGYLTAGIAVGGGALFFLWRRKVPDLGVKIGLRQARQGGGWLKALGYGLAGGLVASACGLVYLRAIDWFPPLSDLRDQTPNLLKPGPGWERTMLLVLLVFAAPLFEEFLFRGLLFRGIRRSSNILVAAVASAAIFAIVHPAISAAPVFVLGLATAVAFEYTGLLLAPILVHVIYNAVVIFAQT